VNSPDPKRPISVDVPAVYVVFLASSLTSQDSSSHA